MVHGNAKSVCAAACLLVSGVVASAALAEPVSAPLVCSVTIEYSRLAQNGQLLDSELYEQTFSVAPGFDFRDDFSTATRFKEFAAAAEAGKQATTVTIDYFNDAGVFHSVEFGAQLTLPNNQKEATTTGYQRFSTSLEPLNGHFDVDYTLFCSR